MQEAKLYKQQPLEERQKKSQSLIERYPDRVPVIVSKLSKQNPRGNLLKTKFLCPKDLTIGQFIHVIRKFLDKVTETQSLFLMLDKSKFLPPTGEKIGDVYYYDKDVDNFLYCVVYTENVFG
jgi:GABA(A) receptor-associated protein